MVYGKYVLTGGPCVGKTHLLDQLAEAGYKTLPEVARKVIEEEQGKEQGTLPWSDFDGFEKLVYSSQMAQEESVKDHTGRVFLDRGLSDLVGYYTIAGKETPSWLEDAIQKHRYDAVFVLDRLPDSYFQTDKARKETPEEAARIHGALIGAYEKAGYSVIRVPWGVDRKKFVEDMIEVLEAKPEDMLRLAYEKDKERCMQRCRVA